MSIRAATYITVASASLIVSSMPVHAHHSYAAFDMEATQSIHGTVSRFEWTNPHVWIWLTPDDGSAEFGIEGHAVTNMVRSGWKPSSLKTGDKITATFHPRKDGARAGSMISIAAPDGTLIPTKP